MYPNYTYGQNYGFVQPQKTEVLKVNGKQGVDAFAMAPNCAGLFLDTTAPRIWLVQTDSAGCKTSIPYAISQEQPEPEIDVKSLVERITKLEELVDAKSNTASPKKSKSE